MNLRLRRHIRQDIPVRRGGHVPARVAATDGQAVAERLVEATDGQAVAERLVEALDDQAVAERPVERHRRAGGPEDLAMYSCGCGFLFDAPVSASVSCPHCGESQAW